jgi:hypothetical protein
MATPVHTTAASQRVFLEHIIDFAGLFPPASLDMKTSVNRYSGYLQHPQRWALGRFVLPVSRLGEFIDVRENDAQRNGAQENAASHPWQLSGILSDRIAADLALVDQFNRKAHGAAIKSVEVRILDLDQLQLVRNHLPSGTVAFVEIPPFRAEEFLPALRQMGASAKLRTGGTSEDAFPAIEHAAEFIARCAEAGVPFKATAGLHHPLRSVRALSYEPNALEGTMHGFLNLFTAAAIAWSATRAGAAVSRTALATCLADADPANWHFGEDALTWSGDEEPMRIDLDCLRSARTKFALSFGSCSFEEPLQDLHGLDLL